MAYAARSRTTAKSMRSGEFVSTDSISSMRTSLRRRPSPDLCAPDHDLLDINFEHALIRFVARFMTFPSLRRGTNKSFRWAWRAAELVRKVVDRDARSVPPIRDEFGIPATTRRGDAMISLLSLPLTALNGTVLAASVWEYVNTSWQPSSSCAPACSGNTTCCHDAASGQSQGACFNAVVRQNSGRQRHAGAAPGGDGPGIGRRNADRWPADGAALWRDAAARQHPCGAGRSRAHRPGGTTHHRAARAVPPRPAQRCALDEPLVALFKSNAVGTRFDVVGVPLAPTTLIKLSPPLAAHPTSPARRREPRRQAAGADLPQRDDPSDADVELHCSRPRQVRWSPGLPVISKLFYIDAPRRSLLGIDLTPVNGRTRCRSSTTSRTGNGPLVRRHPRRRPEHAAARLAFGRPPRRRRRRRHRVDRLISRSERKRRPLVGGRRRRGVRDSAHRRADRVCRREARSVSDRELAAAAGRVHQACVFLHDGLPRVLPMSDFLTI